MSSGSGQRVVDYGLRHLQALTGVPDYACPTWPEASAYLACDTLVPEGEHLIPEGGDWNLPGAVWWWLSRREELHGPRDEHGRWDPSDSLAWQLREEPVLDGWSPEFVGQAQARSDELGHPLVLMAPWPEGAPMALSGTHDVDTARKWRWPTILSYLLGCGQPAKLGRGQVIRELRAIGRGARDPWWNFRPIRDLEREAGLDSTWFVTPRHRHRRDPKFHLGDRAARAMVDRLRGEGQELGVHGSYLDLDRPDLFGRERSELAAPAGIRHHYLRFTVETCWPHQARAGYRYDSSLGFAHGWGFRSGTAYPHPAWDHEAQRALDLGELPLTLMDREGRAAGPELVPRLFKAVGHGHLNLLYHVSVFDDRDFPGLGAQYEAFLKAARDRQAWRATCEQVWDWWQRRARVNLVPDATGLTVTSQRPLAGLVLQGPLEPPAEGRAVGNQLHLPPLEPEVPLRLTWS